MALGYLDDSKLYAIASAIRGKTSKSATMTVDEMPDEIESITTGAVVEPLNVTANGVYAAPAGQGYTPVTVSVPQEGITADQVAERTISGAAVGNATSIYTYAFYNCTQLTTANFPSATSIGSNAFYGCSHLTTANFPSATSIGSNAFYGCSQLTTASFPVATLISTSAFYGCSHLTTANFPSATSIGGYVFYSCRNLTTASFPVATSINNQAFRYCYNLIELHLTSISAVPTLGTSAFASTPIGNYSASAGQYGSVFVPASLYSSFLTATNWSSVSSRIVSVP